MEIEKKTHNKTKQSLVYVISCHNKKKTLTLIKKKYKNRMDKIKVLLEHHYKQYKTKLDLL